jgi:hypothetical protein
MEENYGKIIVKELVPRLRREPDTLGQKSGVLTLS